MTNTAKTACQCRNFADATTGQTLECTATTARKFAPGHDARLKGHLIRIGRAGHQVRVAGREDAVTVYEAADGFGFGTQVFAGVNRPTKARKAKAAPAPAKITAKVGRWTYEGEILAAGDGSPVFRYLNKKGETVDALKFTKI